MFTGLTILGTTSKKNILTHTFELKCISKYQLFFHWKSFENIWSLILYLEAGETELINTCVVPFAIAEFGQKCLEAASTLKYEPLNSCITVHSVWIMKIFNVMLLNTCSRNKRRKNCEESRWRSQSVLVRPLAMPCLIDAKISLVPKHQLIVPSTLLALLQQTSEDTKPQRYIRLHHWHMSHFFKTPQKCYEWRCQGIKGRFTGAPNENIVQNHLNMA